MTRRRAARFGAIQALYQAELSGVPIERVIAEFQAHRLADLLTREPASVLEFVADAGYVGLGLGHETEHQRTGKRPGLRGQVARAAYAHARFLQHFARDCLFQRFARFDETVGRLLECLNRRDLFETTLIVFASDNGFRPDRERPQRHDGRSKLSPYEDGLRTPVLLRWDGRIRPAEHRQPISTVDLVPTVLSAVGLSAEITPRMHGRDLMDAAVARRPLRQRPVFGAVYPNDAATLGRPRLHVRGRWVRDGVFKLIVPGPAEPAVPLSLFDLSSDPDEIRNLALDPAYADRVARMRKLLDQWWPALQR